MFFLIKKQIDRISQDKKRLEKSTQREPGVRMAHE